MTKKELKRRSHRFVDPLYKWVIFALGLDKLYMKCLKASYKGDNLPLWKFELAFGKNTLRVCENLYNSKRRKTKLARVKICRSVISSNCFFVTLTFKDEVLKKTCEKTRRQYVQRMLNKISLSYVANIDYGKSTEREHYHALIDPYPFCFASWKNGKKSYKNVPDLREWINLYGFVDIRKVGDLESDLARVCKYTSKLAFHAVKDSTRKGKKVNRLMYSRRTYRT